MTLSWLRLRPFAAIVTALAFIACTSLSTMTMGFQREFSTGVYRSEVDSLAKSFSITEAQPHGIKATGIQSLSDSDVRALERSLNPSLVDHVIPIAQGAAIIKYHENEFHGGLVGGPSDYLTYMQTPLLAGSMFTEEQVSSGARVVLAGPAVVQALFNGNGAAALGSKVMIGRLRFQIIGLLGKDATGGNAAVSVAPLTTVRQSLLGGVRTVGTIGIVTKSVAAVPPATDQATSILENSHTPRKTGLQDDFTTTTFESAQPAIARKLIIALFWFAFFTALAALVVGCSGLLTLVLGEIRGRNYRGERNYETGIRKAIGAKKTKIVKVILMNSTFFSTFFGTIGTGLGVALGWFGEGILAGVAPQLGGPHLVSPDVVVVSLIIGPLAGLIAGFYPAIRAGRVGISAGLLEETPAS